MKETLINVGEIKNSACFLGVTGVIIYGNDLLSYQAHTLNCASRIKKVNNITCLADKETLLKKYFAVVVADSFKLRGENSFGQLNNLDSFEILLSCGF